MQGSDDRFFFISSQDGVYESVTLSTATKPHICTAFQLLESFTETGGVDLELSVNCRGRMENSARPKNVIQKTDIFNFRHLTWITYSLQLEF